MKKIITEIFGFYRNPTDTRIENWSWSKNIKYLGYVFLIDLVCSLFIALLEWAFLDKDSSPVDTDMIVYRQNTLRYLLLGTIVFAPLLEEIIFRLPLRYNKFYALFINRKKWDFIFKFLVYLFPIAFGLVHLSNYGSFKYNMLFLFPLIVGSQIIGGFAYTYLRVKFNFLTTLAIHMIWNFVFISIALIGSYFVEPYIKNSKNYKIEIKSFEYNDIKKQYLKIDSSNNKVYEVEVRQLSANRVLDSLFKYKRNKEDQIINLKFESQNGVSKKEFIKIVNEYDEKEN